MTLVARMPFEILALIFENCAKIDWTAPLRLGGVCQSWRQVVHYTPRAWRFMDVEARRKCRKLYFDRSRPYTLYISVKDPYNIGNIKDEAHRIQYMTTPYVDEDMPACTLPALTTLRCIDTHSIWAERLNADHITNLRFPNLRHLEIHYTHAAPSCDNLPPLRSLQIVVRDHIGWPDVITACSASLVSLQVTCMGPVYYSVESYIELPRLHHLQFVKEWGKDGGWPLTLRTPGLRVYIEDDGGNYFGQTLHEDILPVTHMRLQRLYTTPSTGSFPNVSVLQLEPSFFGFCCALNELQEDPSLCSSLRCLEFHSRFMDEDEIDEAHQMLERFEWKSRTNAALPTINDHWITEFPVEEFTEV